MGAITKFYLHDAASGDTGSLPGSSTLDASSPTVTATGASTNRSMDGTRGASQTSISTTNASGTTAQSAWHRRYLSLPLAAQTISAQTLTYSLAASESNASSNFNPTIGVYLWRPSTGAIVSTIMAVGTITATEPGTSETAVSGTGTSTSQTCLAGDILVVETWRASVAQGASTARTSVSYYDGTTEASASNNAAFVGFTTGVIVPLSYSRTSSDSPSTADSPSRTLVLGKTSADSPTTADSVTRTAMYSRIDADAPQTTDAPARTVVLFRSAADAPSTVEMAARAGTFARSMADAPRTMEAASEMVTSARSAADAPSTMEAAHRTVALSRAATDMSQTIDVSIEAVSIAVQVADAPHVSDMGTRVVAFQRTAADVPQTSDMVVAWAIQLVGISLTMGWQIEPTVVPLVIYGGAAADREWHIPPRPLPVGSEMGYGWQVRQASGLPMAMAYHIHQLTVAQSAVSWGIRTVVGGACEPAWQTAYKRLPDVSLAWIDAELPLWYRSKDETLRKQLPSAPFVQDNAVALWVKHLVLDTTANQGDCSSL